MIDTKEGKLLKLKNNFNIMWHYLQDDKLKLVLYLLLVILTYIPGLITAFLWGAALEHLTNNNLKMFLFMVLLWEGLHILFYVIL